MGPVCALHMHLNVILVNLKVYSTLILILSIQFQLLKDEEMAVHASPQNTPFKRKVLLPRGPETATSQQQQESMMMQQSVTLIGFS